MHRTARLALSPQAPSHAVILYIFAPVCPKAASSFPLCRLLHSTPLSFFCRGFLTRTTGSSLSTPFPFFFLLLKNKHLFLFHHGNNKLSFFSFFFPFFSFFFFFFKLSRASRCIDTLGLTWPPGSTPISANAPPPRRDRGFPWCFMFRPAAARRRWC